MDAKSTKELAITGVLVLVLGIVVYMNVFSSGSALKQSQATRTGTPQDAKIPGGGPKPSAPKPKAAAPVKVDAKKAKEMGIDIAKLGVRDERAITLQEAIMQKPWGRDPFFSMNVGVTSEKGRLKLKGISWHPDAARALVMINDEIMMIGDVIEDSEIVNIEKNRVTLEQDGREYFLILEEEVDDDNDKRIRTK